ncbi:MAG: AI-2E family transporter [Candidatus Paceibacterota bacterium]
MTSQSKNHFFFGLLLAVIALAVVMFLPFLTSIVLAAALAVVSGPLYRWITRLFFGGKPKSSLAALLTIIVVVVIVLVPLLLISGQIYVEVQNMYAYLIDESGRSETISALNGVSASISHIFLDLYPAQSFDSFNITTIISHGLEWMFDNLNVVFNGLSRMAIGVFIMLLSLFYFLRDGQELKRQIIQLSPLGDADDEQVLHKLRQTIYAIFGGSIAIGIIQGIMTGVGFAIFSVPNPAVWGSVAAVAALIPGIGTSLVLIPGIIYMFITGSTPHAVGLLIWSLIAVGLVDNLLGPLFVSRGARVHPLLVLLSVFGGLTLFGVIGFVLGPLVLAFLFALLDIYKTLALRRN